MAIYSHSSKIKSSDLLLSGSRGTPWTYRVGLCRTRGASGRGGCADMVSDV